MLTNNANEPTDGQISTDRFSMMEEVLIANLTIEENEEEPFNMRLKQKYFDNLNGKTPKMVQKKSLKKKSPRQSSFDSLDEYNRVTLDKRVIHEGSTELDRFNADF